MWRTPLVSASSCAAVPRMRLCRNHPDLRPSLFGARVPSLGRNSRNVQVEAVNASVEELPPNLKDIVGAFQMVPDPMARYKQLLYFATKLEPLANEHHTEENKVQGCVSQVWVKATIDNGFMNFQADSDSQLTKGLAALLVQGLSGSTPQQILSIQPTFIESLGLKQSLTPSRNNGFLNMFKLMQRKTLETAAKCIKEEELSNSESPSASTDQESSSSASPVTESIYRKLDNGLVPQVLNIVNQSEQHAHHAGMHGVEQTGETHFRIEIVSEKFSGVSLVKRHRMVYDLLSEEMAGSVHALSLDTKAPEDLN